MCRIAGVVSANNRLNSKADIQRMLSVLKHGGPDDEGIFIDQKVSFGHRRLSIIDLSSDGHQPMLSEDESVVLNYNGEIYNFLELRKQIDPTENSFRTKTDTEVLIRAYQKWGILCVSKLEGIFAFALYDKKNQKIFIARDQIGIKPIYYSVDKDKLIFASEVRAFTALKKDWSENKNWRTLFLAFGSLPIPFTTLESVYQLEPGAFLEFDLSKFEFKVEKYYLPQPNDYPLNTSELALPVIGDALKKALHKNMISDAPLGIFLSGGIDSSLLTLLADQSEQNVKTVSVNFEDASFDERPFQQAILDRTQHLEHHSYNVTEPVFWQNLDDIWQSMDQPSIDGVNTYFVSHCAKKAGLKAVLSGVGADEIFGGYESVKRILWLKRLRRLPFKRVLAQLLGNFKKPLKRIVFLTMNGPIGDYLFLRGIHTPDEIASLLKITEEQVWDVLKTVKMESPKAKDDREYASALESRMYLTSQLLKDTDAMSMWHGLEVRAPFLDVALLQKVNQVSPHIRFSTLAPKYLITQSNKNLLPSEIVYRKKAGFTFPFAVWMKNNPSKFRALVSTDKATDKIIQDFESGQSHWSKYWSLVVLNQFKFLVAVNCIQMIEVF